MKWHGALAFGPFAMTLQRLDALAARGELVQARKLFEAMPKKQRVVWNVMLKAVWPLAEAFSEVSRRFFMVFGAVGTGFGGRRTRMRRTSREL